ncbi:MAG: hypothetical protein IJJ44_10495 [Solobacterium sp.]|nr:hypothetical protein [Solobacterium sp.]
MNTEYSIEHFVKTFIRKNRRERLLFELTKEDRYDGVSRFCHQAKELLEPSRILMKGKDMDRTQEFQRFLKQHHETCLVLSPDSSMDGQCLSLGDAVKQAEMCLDAVLILGSTFTVVYTEPMKGGRDKYLLSESK